MFAIFLVSWHVLVWCGVPCVFTLPFQRGIRKGNSGIRSGQDILAALVNIAPRSKKLDLAKIPKTSEDSVVGWRGDIHLSPTEASRECC